MRFSSLVDRLDSSGGTAWDIHNAARQAESLGEDVILLSVGDPDFATPDPIVERAIAALRAGDTHYTAIPGKAALRTAIADLLRRRTGVETESANVMVVAGAQNGLFATALALCEIGDEVIVIEPMYLTYEATIAVAGATLVRIPASAEDGFRPRVVDLDAAVTSRTRAIFIANPNNPTGTVMTEAELRQVADVAQRHDLWVVVDEVYDSLVFEGVHLGFRALPGMAERTVAIGSLSKSHAMTGWRIGWLVGPGAFISHVERLALNMLYGLPGFIQEAALTALQDYDTTTDTMRTIYGRRLALVSRHLADVPGLGVLRPEAGMFCLVDVRGTGLSSYDFAWGLYRQTGVSLLDAAAFGPATQGFVRLAFAASEERLSEACDRIARYASSLVLSSPNY